MRDKNTTEYPNAFIEQSDDFDLESLKQKAKEEPTSEEIADQERRLEVYKLFKTVKDKIRLEANGHYNYGTRELVYQSYLKDLLSSLSTRVLDATPELEEVLKNPGKNKIFLNIYASASCSNCGKRQTFVFDGEVISPVEKCDYPDGLPAYEFELNIPSGKMVVANDLRGIFRETVGNRYVNHEIEIWRTVQDYAKIGMAHCFVGNTCPGFFEVDSKTFAIGNPGYDPDTDEEKETPRDGKQVAGVCTDLWWYSIVDYDEYVRRAGEEPNDHCEIVDCEPGVYKFVHQYHLIDNDNYGSVQVYSFIDWVREPDPLQDYVSEYNSMHLTAGQAAHYLMKKHGDIYPHVYVAVEQLLFHGRDIHPNGWVIPGPDVDVNSPEVEIPEFDEEFYCFDLSEHSVFGTVLGLDTYRGSREPFRMNDSFMALCFNVLRCIVKHGVKRLSSDKTGTRQKETVKTAKKYLQKMIELYPDLVPENCKEFVPKKKKSKANL